jgi:hypothetical protein
LGQALVWPERPWPLPWPQGKLKRKVDIMARRTNNKLVSDPFVSSYFLFFFFLILFPPVQSLQPMLRISTSQMMKKIPTGIRRTGEEDIMKQNEQKETKERMMKSGNMTIW